VFSLIFKACIKVQFMNNGVRRHIVIKIIIDYILLPEFELQPYYYNHITMLHQLKFKGLLMHFKKSIIALALASTLAACGGSSSPSTPKAPVVPVETVVDGRAIKGVLTNAVVTVYKFVDGAPILLTEDELKEADVSTDASGNYSFTVLNYDGPIKIELSPSTDPSEPTTMICDAPAGCGDTPFGVEINLTAADPTFKLAAISVVDKDSQGAVKMNVSALTHLAAALIEADEVGITADSISTNSQKIATTFGINGDITKLEPTVIDGTGKNVAKEDNEAELRYGSINAGIMAALFSGENDGTDVLSSKLKDVALKLVANDGELLGSQDDDDSTFELALNDITKGQTAVLAAAAEANKEDSVESTIDLAQLETELENELIFKLSTIGDDGFVKVITDVPTEGDAVAKAKAMVEDVRLFSHLFKKDSNEGKDIRQGDKYTELMENANTMINAEADSFELLGNISVLVSDLNVNYKNGVLTEEAAKAGINIADHLTGVTGTIIYQAETATGGILFKVNAISGDEKVSLTTGAEFSADKKSITLSVNGTVESAGAKFTLAEGSFAQVDLDTAASRDVIENDTYVGNVVSAELKLDLTLEQKATSAVTNPITFTGMLHTTLLPVAEHVLYDDWGYNNDSGQYGRIYHKPAVETFALPDMLSLSGEFNSLDGDSISAALTVSINNLEDYKAPDFKFIGKPVDDVVTITLNENLIEARVSDKVIADDEEESNRSETTFTKGSETGEWFALIKYINDNHPNIIEEKRHYSRRFDSGLTEKGIQYTVADLELDLNDSNKNEFWATSIRITPIDSTGDGNADYYNVSERTSESNTISQLSELVNDDGDILDQSQWYMTVHGSPSIDDYVKKYFFDMPANPLTIDTLAKVFTRFELNDGEWNFNIKDVGEVNIEFTEEELDQVANGTITTLNPTAYLIKPIIKDALSIEVSDDANTVTAASAGVFTATHTFSGGAGEEFTYRVEGTKSNGHSSSLSVWSEVYATNGDNDNGLDIPDVIVNSVIEEAYEGSSKYSHKLKFKAVDDQLEGEVGFGIADRIEVYYIGGWNHIIKDDGALVNVNSHDDSSDDVVVDFTGSSWLMASFDAYSDFDWSTEAWGGYYNNPLPFNPLTIDSALEAMTAIFLHSEDYQGSRWIDDIGEVEVVLHEGKNKDKLLAITAGSTTLFDGINTSADTNNLLEDENTFLKGNAALTLEAILGDYQVKMQLSGERTAFEAGEFDLAMSYRLPDEASQRSFTVQYNTEEEDSLTASNFEGVVLVLKEADDKVSGTQVIGQILVGPEQFEAATIEDRDGAVFIIYSDIDGDGIKEEESL